MTFFEVTQRYRERKFVILASVLYSLMHAGILFIPFAVFWDDWILVDTSNETTLETFRQLGAMFNLMGYLHVGLISLGVWTYKVFTFFLMGAAGYFLNAILKRNGAFECHLRWIIVLLFMLLPFNMARVALIDFPYVACYALFFGAWWAIDRYRILAAILFFISFNTNSLLVFYALPVLDMLYRSSGRFTVLTLFRLALARWELMILPFLYFGIKTLFYKPVGFYAGYNQGYSLALVPGAIESQAKELLNLQFNIITIVMFFPFVYIALRKVFYSSESTEYIFSRCGLLILGGIAITLGGFPYWILGHVPTFTEWTSRHQLLMPLGVALLISGALMYAPKKARTVSTAFIISACLSYGMITYFNFYVDWQKQLFIVDKFKNDSVVAKANFVIIEDQTKNLDAIGRTHRFYEWNGMLVRAFGDERRFAVEFKDSSRYAQGDFDKYFTAKYKAGEHVRGAGEFVAVVRLDLKIIDKKNIYSELVPKIEYRSRLLTPEEWTQIAAGSKEKIK